MVAATVRSRATRTLHALASYVPFDAGSKKFTVSSSSETGDVLGVYENPSLVDGKVFIFEKGIIISNGSDLFAPFCEIIEVIYEDVGDVIWLKMRGLASHCFRIAGRSGKFLDATEFVRFLDRVVADCNP